MRHPSDFQAHQNFLGQKPNTTNRFEPNFVLDASGPLAQPVAQGCNIRVI